MLLDHYKSNQIKSRLLSHHHSTGGDAAGQDALHSAGVECSEDAGAHSKLPQPSQEEEALM